MNKFILLTLALFATPAAAQTTPPVPASHIPPAVVAELRTLENQFDLALANDCAPERCFSKGCVYGEHSVVDKPRSTSLPGLGASEGPGSVAPQEYLTQARCEFAHEKSVATRDVQGLIKRLEQKLSKGWLVVRVEHRVLEPISSSLRESPKPPELKLPEPAKAPEQTVAPEPEWTVAVAIRELWNALLPHFSWMIALFLVTLAALTLIWAWRRLGKETLEEKALLASLSEPAKPTDAAVTTESVPAETSEDEDARFVTEQQTLWNARLASAELTPDEGVVSDLLREWLRTRDFAMLAKAAFIFSERLPLAFPNDGELASRKVEFAEYMRSVDESTLPPDSEFFKKLNHHAIASTLLSQSDAEAFRELREAYGATGIAQLIEQLPPRHGALLYALTSPEGQGEVARMLSEKLRVHVAQQLLVSNRISKEETAYILSALTAARAGKALPRVPESFNIVDRGQELDVAKALSILLSHVAPQNRSALFNEALQRTGGSFPAWYDQILFADMLSKVPDELRADLLLDVDMRALAGWLSLQNTAWQEQFLPRLSSTMQNAVRASMAFGSRAEQQSLADRGRRELSLALQKRVARGQLSFADVIV